MYVRTVERHQAVIRILFKRLHLVATGNLCVVIMHSVHKYCDIIFGQCNVNVLRTARDYAREGDGS